MTEDDDGDLVVSLSVESHELDPSSGRFRNALGAVSYTHLTLPTICSV